MLLQKEEDKPIMIYILATPDNPPNRTFATQIMYL